MDTQTQTDMNHACHQSTMTEASTSSGVDIKKTSESMQFKNLSKNRVKQEGKCVSAKKVSKGKTSKNSRIIQKGKYCEHKRKCKITAKKEDIADEGGFLEETVLLETTQQETSLHAEINDSKRHEEIERHDTTASVDMDDVEYIPILAVTERVVSSEGVDSSKKKKVLVR
ncbi:hypothetical protein JTB14_000562 [Gonioctena quinquepunctata]|nr:hypothetical protein JTB14_000562 [Gonioctena quinquepunctata]